MKCCKPQTCCQPVQGPTGPTGPRGFQGPSGTTGFTGPTGPGNEGFCALQDCAIDTTCGGIFPCPPASGNILSVPGTYPTIQDAVDAAVDGDTILVAPGLYPEAVVITGPLSNVRIISTTLGGADIASPFPPGAPIPALNTANVTIDGAECIQLQNFTITMPSQGGVGIASGINVINNGSAIISGNIIQADIPANITGNQAGRAIGLDTGASALIVGNTISGYQKTGMRINGTGTCGLVYNNSVTGFGPTSVNAQNGIQVSRGATSIVQGNVVSRNIFTGMSFFASGILLFQEGQEFGGDVCVMSNSFFTNDTGIGMSLTFGSLIQTNNSSNNILYGLYVEDSAFNRIIRNLFNNNGVFSINDTTAGSASGMSANFYLCNSCNTTDNRGGALCDSISPFPVPPSPLVIGIPTTEQILNSFNFPQSTPVPQPD